MYPIILKIGSLSISSFGFFLALSFFTSVFLAWRLAKAYELNEEKIIDLVILVFISGIIGARLFFVSTHWSLFGDLEKILKVNNYAGLSFWGGMLAGVLALKFFATKLKFNFWQVADFAAVSFLLGIIVGNLGCFFGGCSYGVVSNSFLATPIVGLVGKRLPVTLIESLLLLPLFYYLWSQAIRFHFTGKISAVALIGLGLIKLILEPYHGDQQLLFPNFGLSFGFLFSILTLILGTAIFYKKSKRHILADLKYLINLPISRKKQKGLVAYLKKNAYNRKVNFDIKIGQMMLVLQTLPKTLKRKLHVKSNPKNII